MPTPVSNAQEQMRSIIQRIATGPELSKDISLEEAREGMSAILRGEISPVQAAIFFIALRMKRESDDENKGILDALREHTQHRVAGVDELVDIADPYDGYNRCLPSSPFLAPVLASLGIAAVSHGLDRVGPKFGITHRHVLEAAGAPVDLTPEQAVARIDDPRLGWSYIDQRVFCPPLHDLVPFRAEMVKRQALTTVEVLTRPIHGQRKTHLVTGYVHKPYPRIYALLARHAGFDSALLVRGVEGGVTPSLRQSGTCFAYQASGQEEPFDIDPRALDIEQTQRTVPLPDDLPKEKRPGDEIQLAVDIPAAARRAAELGIKALQGEKGPTYDGLVLTGALVLHHLGRVSRLQQGAEQVRQVLDNGAALARLA